jgi:hypothetical protein
MNVRCLLKLLMSGPLVGARSADFDNNSMRIQPQSPNENLLYFVDRGRSRTRICYQVGSTTAIPKDIVLHAETCR